MDPQTYGQLIFDKSGKNIQWNKDSLFGKCCWETTSARDFGKSLRQVLLGKLSSNMQKNEPRPLTPYTKINSKWMKDLNVRQETIKILEEKAGKNLFDIGYNFLLNTSPDARETKAKMNYWDLIKIKSFCTAMETINKTNGIDRKSVV